MDTSGDFTQQIMDFRTSYVRAVARASVDLQFRKDLTDPQNDPLEVLEKAFGYKCPWDLTLVLRDDPQRGPRLNPTQGRIMTLPYWGEAITVFIPARPPGDDAKTQLDALAAYYQQNPWIPRTKQAADGKRYVPKSLGSASPAVDATWASVKRGRYNLGDNMDDFISFAAAIFNAVALAWDNELMWNDLTAYNGGPGQPRKRTITLLSEWIGYTYPWDLDLIIQKDETAKYDGSTGQWVNTTPPVLMLTLPWMTGADARAGVAKDAVTEVAQNNAKPGVAIMGVALYNTDGPGYPFTCG